MNPNMRNKLSKIIMGLVWAGSFVFGASGLAMAQEPAPAQAVAPVAAAAPGPLLFLINATSKIAVEVDIPERFAPIVGAEKVQEAIQHGLIEFVPRTELNSAQWTELLTIIPLSNTGTQAYTFRDSVMGELKDKTKEFKMLNSAFKNEKEYQVATAVARYELNGRNRNFIFLCGIGSSEFG
jgi:hypothetical protein